MKSKWNSKKKIFPIIIDEQSGGSITLILVMHYEISVDFQHFLHLTWLDLCVTVLLFTSLYSQIKSLPQAYFCLTSIVSSTYVYSFWELFSLSQPLLCGILWDFILTLLPCFRKNIAWWSAVIRVQNRWKRICCCHGHKGKKRFFVTVEFLLWDGSFERTPPFMGRKIWSGKMLT